MAWKDSNVSRFLGRSARLKNIIYIYISTSARSVWRVADKRLLMFVSHSWDSMRAESWKSLNRTNQRDAVLSHTKAFGNCFFGLPFARCWTRVSVLLCEVRRVFCIATCAGRVKVDGVCLVVVFFPLHAWSDPSLWSLTVYSYWARDPAWFLEWRGSAALAPFPVSWTHRWPERDVDEHVTDA